MTTIDEAKAHLEERVRRADAPGAWSGGSADVDTEHLRTLLSSYDEMKGRIEEAVRLCQDSWGALNFILAFYEPGQNHLDTNAWKQAEATGRRVHAALASFVSREKVDGGARG